jgi:septal ring factor EnvC (AmiA/AmiB activator)
LPRVPRPEQALTLVLALLLAGAANADPSPQDRLKALQQQIDASRAQQDAAAQQAAALATELAQLQAQSVEAARTAQAHEAALSATEAQLRALASDAAAKSAALGRDTGNERVLLMALTRVAATPREAMALAPRPPLDSVRGALVMARTVVPLEAHAADLRHDIAALASERRDIETAEARHLAERQDLAADTARIAALVAQKTALYDSAQRTAADSGIRLAGLATESASLRELIDRIEAQRKAEAQAALALPPPVLPPGAAKAKPFAEAQGELVYPAAGALVARFGAPDENGTPSRGLTFETRPSAQVVAPYDGQVEFAGPFRGYGQILIIAHGDGYHSLLAGLDRVDSSVGQWLVAGEPVGTMAATEKPHLYLELRHNNQPINPAPWLTTRVEKVNG